MMQCILIVDDEDTLCKALRFNLEDKGYEVDTANTAEAILAMDVSAMTSFCLI
ncbi:MAG: hypothetical protein K2K00_02095 [Muribaculaceae bacterium]|nr:hypothetical protein [Muribaculaceae bacterium]